MVTELDVLIVGGGWTGVSAALTLHEHNEAHPDDAATFALLEGHPSRLGGRAYSYDYTWTDERNVHHTTAFEHGAQYVGKEQTALWDLIQRAIEHKLISRDALVDGYAARLPYKEQVMMIAGKRYPYNRDEALFGIGGVPPELGLWDVIGVLVIVQAIQAAERAIDVLSPWKSPDWVTELDGVTLLEWIDLFHLPPGAVSLLRVSVQAVISVQAREVSAFYFFWYCACNGGFLNEVNDEKDGPQQYYLASGFDDLIKKLTAPVNDRIMLGQTVRTVTYGGDGTVTVTTDDRTFRAKKLIVATSPASAQNIQFDPPLPAAWQRITQQSMGTTVKCQVFYRSPWWRNVPEQADPQKEGVPQYTGYCGANNYPVTWVMDYSPVGPPSDYADQGCYALMTFTIGAEAQKLLQDPTRDHIVQWVTTALCDLFNDTRALASSSEFIDLKWFVWDANTPLIPGGPNTVFTSGILTGPDAPAKAFDTPIDGKVYFASAELSCKSPAARKSPLPTFAPDWHTFGEEGTYSDYRQSLGYMDGAVTCGQFVARQVLEDLSLRDPSKGKPPVDAVASSAAADAVPSPLPTATGGQPISAATVCAALATLCQRIYTDSANGWKTPDRKADPKALKKWLAGVLVEMLVVNGLVDPPPQEPAPGFNQAQAEAYMKEMVVWQPKFMGAILSFISSGYDLQSTVSEVARLASLASELMEVKSSEFTGANTGPGPSIGRLSSFGQTVNMPAASGSA